MAKTKEEVAVIPSEYFRWRAGVQFIESFQERTSALRFARRHGYNLVVECDEGNGPQYEVLKDASLPSRPAGGFTLMDALNALISLPR